jgi:RecB family exonuclease
VRFAAGEAAGGIALQAARLLDLYLADHAPRPADILAVEWPVSLPPDALGVPVRGRPDLLLASPSGPVLVEFKTGRMPLDARRAAEAAAQAALYASASELAGDPPARGRVVLLRRLKTPRIETAELSLGAADRGRALQSLSEDWRLLSAARSAGAFPARPGWSCDSCPYARRCAAETNDTAPGPDAPTGPGGTAGRPPSTS